MRVLLNNAIKIRDQFRRIDKCEDSLSEFIKAAWHAAQPGEKYVHGWVIDATCEHLEAVTNGQIRRLAINIPPGCMKSLMLNVFYPAWEWGPKRMPHLRYVKASYNIDLPIRDNIILRNLITSEWYQKYYPHVCLKLKRDKKISTNKNGFSQACAFSSLTGGRGHRLILDDTLSTENAESDAILLKAERIFKESSQTRLVNPALSAIILIMQRLHPKDTTALALELGYEHLMLPMEFEPHRKCFTSIGFEDPRKEEGELLFTERFPRKIVDELKIPLGTYGVACQFQQNPVPREGAIIKHEWVKNRFKLPRDQYGRILLYEFKERFQSWDTAFKDGEQNDYSVCTTWGIKDNGYYLLNCFKMKCDFPKLEDKCIELASFWAPNQILIEDKASGQSLIQSLQKRTKLPIKAVKIDRDKIARLNAVSGYFEAERVWFPEKEPWLDDYLKELTEFPAVAHDDQVDTTSQFFLQAVLRRENALKSHVGSTIGR